MPRRNDAGADPLPRVLIVGCGALGRELVAITRDLPGVDVTCLPAELHNRPEQIPDAVVGRIRERGGEYERVFVAYADCGTGGALDRALAGGFKGVERIPGAHCYEFYAGGAAFAALAEEEPGTFYLTDFLARHFDRLVMRGLGLDRHPELLPQYFGNYRRLVYLAQAEDPDLVARARAAADRLGLAFELRQTGLGELGDAVRRASDPGSGPSLQLGAPPVPHPGAPPVPHPVPHPAAPTSASVMPRPCDDIGPTGQTLSASIPLPPLPRGSHRHKLGRLESAAGTEAPGTRPVALAPVPADAGSGRNG